MKKSTNVNVNMAIYEIGLVDAIKTGQCKWLGVYI